MKRCTYCGQQYPDDATVCTIDSKPLKMVTATLQQGMVTQDADKLLHSIAGVAEVASGNLGGLTHVPALSHRETQFGVCLVWKCPRCNDLRDFRLVEGEVNVSILGIDLSNLGRMLDLRCKHCRFELKVDPAEKPLVAKAAEATQMLKAGQIAPDAYIALITNLPARFIKNLFALTQNWHCPSCGEENPINFQTCWNCSSKASADIGVSDDAKPFPGLPRGGNPWE